MSRRIQLLFATMLYVFTMTASLSAQTDFADKMRSEINESAIAEVTIDDFAWMTGHWEAEAFGGIAEDIWAPPRAGYMVGLFRSTTDKGVNFYEIITLGEQDGIFMMRLKHFTAELHGWETKDETVDFILADRGENIWYFKALTIERHSADAMTIYVRLRSSEGTNIVPFRFKRVRL